MSGPSPELVAGDVDRLRGELGRLVGELDRRRHEALDLGLQLRRHPLAATLAAALAAAALGGLAALVLGQRRRRRRPLRRAREVRGALARLIDHPDRVAAETTLTGKLLGAAGVVVATAVARRLVDRALPPRRAPPAPPAP